MKDKVPAEDRLDALERTFAFMAEKLAQRSLALQELLDQKGIVTKSEVADRMRVLDETSILEQAYGADPAVELHELRGKPMIAPTGKPMTWDAILEAFRLSTFQQALAKHGGNAASAAKELDVNRSWFYKVLREAKNDLPDEEMGRPAPPPPTKEEEPS